MQNDRRETLVAFGQFTLVRVGDALLALIAAHLAMLHYSPFQVVFFYSAVGVLCMLPWALRHTGTLWRPQRMRLNLLRAFFEFGSFALGFYALQQLDVSKQTAISFGAPLFSTVLAILWLKEKAHTHTWLSLLLGFAGMLVVTRPGVIPLDIYVVAAVVSAMGFGLCGILIKRLTTTESPNHIAFYVLGLSALMALPFALTHWKTPDLAALFWLTAVGVIGWSQQVLVAASMAKVPVLTLLPLNFLRLVFVAILSYLIYDQVIDRWTLIGAVVIMVATLYDTWATTRKAREIRHP